MVKVYCVIGVEYTMETIPGRIHLLGVFSTLEKAKNTVSKSDSSFVDIIESELDKLNDLSNDYINIAMTKANKLNI